MTTTTRTHTLPPAARRKRQTNANAHDDEEVRIGRTSARSELGMFLKSVCGGVYIYGAVNESERWGWRRGMKRQGLAVERFGIHRTTTNDTGDLRNAMNDSDSLPETSV